MDRNGYFELESKENGTFLRIIAPEGNGQKASLEWLITYLDKQKVEYGSLNKLKTCFEQASKGESVCISENSTIPFSGWCEYSVSTSGMQVQMTMFPHMIGREDPTIDDIAKDLTNIRVAYGVNVNLIKAILGAKRYFETFIIAKGKDPRDGKDAVLTYNFNTEIDTTPKINEDGTVDFHQLDVINKVKAGDVVATIEKEDPGDSGINVYGQEVKPKKVYKKNFRFGKNMHVSADGTQLISDVTGHVSLAGDQVFVSNEYVVEADVDTTTGDINFDGNVRVRGAVRSGFKVKATGNVTIDGVVEAAEIEAGGDIVLARGISGQGRGTLLSEGSIISTFIENATVTAKKKLEVDAVLHSRISVGESILAKGRSGSIIGGHTRAGVMITAKEIGSKMGTNTIIAMGSDAEEFKRVSELQERIDNETKDKEKIIQLVEMLKIKKMKDGGLDPKLMEQLQNATKSMVLLGNSIESNMEELTKINSCLHNSDDARIKIERSIFQGVKLEFGQDAMFIRDRVDHCQYVKKGADITMIAL